MGGGQFLDGTPVGASIDRSIIELAHVIVRALELEQVHSGAVRAGGTGQNDVVVPNEELPFTRGRFVPIHVLCVAVSEAVPVANTMFHGKCAQPLFSIDDRFDCSEEE